MTIDLEQYNSDKTFKYVAWESLYIEEGFNVRDETSYVAEEISALADNIKRLGLTTPIVVSKQEDGRHKIVRGHRRYKAMSLIRQEEAKLVEAGSMSRKDMSFAKVLCDVKANMKTADEVVLMIDHGNTKPLDKAEVFKAVKRLYDLGSKWGETEIRNHLGLTRGNVTQHWRMVHMPEDMQTEYLKSLKNDPLADPKIGNAEVTALFEAFTKDKKANRFGGAVGSELRRAFDKIKDEQKLTPDQRGKSPKKALEDAQIRVGNKAGGRYLGYFISHMLGNDSGIPALEDVVVNICLALSEVFPDEPEQVVTVHEEGLANVI